MTQQYTFVSKLYLADHPAGTGCWLGDPNNVNGRAWFSGDPKIITKCENYGLNPVKLALALTEALFTREEMAASNVRGTRGKESLDPSKIKAIRGKSVKLKMMFSLFCSAQLINIKKIVGSLPNILSILTCTVFIAKHTVKAIQLPLEKQH